MHPEIKMEKPGNCPKCGMTLIKKTIKVSVPKPPVNKPILKNKKEEKVPSTKVESKAQNPTMPMDDKEKNEDKTDQSIAEDFIGDRVNMLPGKTVVYHLYVTDTLVNFTGKTKHAYAINGSIPSPTLVFTEGDTAEIYLHNNLMTEETSLHWHGIILPNRFDGVPYLTTARIGPGETHLYKFPVVQNGTYWYHSHSKLQEQAGMYGALVFNKREEPLLHTKKVSNSSMQMSSDSTGKMNLFDAEYTLVLSEWTDEKPKEVQRRLRSANDWYAIQKGSVQSYSEAIKSGHFKTKLLNEWKRMKAMDVSDVYYQRFLINGKSETSLSQFKAGDKLRLRVINAGASSYFWLQYAGGKLTVVANDGNDVEPVEVDRLIIGVAETYDVLVTIPGNMSFEFRATPEDRTQATSLWLGSGSKMTAHVLPRLKYFEGMKMMNDMMKANGNMKTMDMKMSLQQMDMNTVMYPELMGEEIQNDSTQVNNANNILKDTMQDMNMGRSADIVTLNYAMLRSPVKTILPEAPYKELQFTLTGNMNRYVWSINNKTVSESDKILIQKGENVRIILFNNSMMRHPMHLHGHDFRVLNGQGEYAPLKNVIDIMPMETDTIEFAANQSGDWFFHCHILYHMMSGMGNVFSYANSPVNPELPDVSVAWRKFKKDNTMVHPMIRAGIETNGSDGEFMLSGDRYSLQGLWHLGYSSHHGYEGELNFGRYIGRNQWFFPYVGFDYHYKMEEQIEKTVFGQVSNKNNRKTFVAGMQYTLPTLFLADARIDGNGKFRFQLSREDIPLTPRLRFALMGNSDKEYMTGFRYIISKWFAVSTHYDSDMGIGAGITLTY
jgi:CopA family copper-resistance protein